MSRARLSTHPYQRATVGVATHYKVIDVSNYTDWSLQWVLEANGAGTATFALFGTALADSDLLDPSNYPTLGTDPRWSTVPYAFSASPAGVANSSSILVVSDSAINALLVAVTVTVELTGFTLAFHGQGRA